MSFPYMKNEHKSELRVNINFLSISFNSLIESDFITCSYKVIYPKTWKYSNGTDCSPLLSQMRFVTVANGTEGMKYGLSNSNSCLTVLVNFEGKVFLFGFAFLGTLVRCMK